MYIHLWGLIKDYFTVKHTDHWDQFWFSVADRTTLLITGGPTTAPLNLSPESPPNFYGL